MIQFLFLIFNIKIMSKKELHIKIDKELKPKIDILKSIYNIKTNSKLITKLIDLETWRAGKG